MGVPVVLLDNPNSVFDSRGAFRHVEGVTPTCQNSAQQVSAELVIEPLRM